MRPRGESISSPKSRYVGHVGRQKPQWTQSSMSAGSGGWCASNAGRISTGVSWRPAPAVARTATPTSWKSADASRAPTACAAARSEAGSEDGAATLDPAHEAAGVEHPVRVELPLDAPHEAEGVAGGAPHVHRRLELRRGLHD